MHIFFSISGELNEAEEIAKIEEQSKKSKSKPMKRQDRKTKDAAMKEIYSESQRMFRESGMKLGYHRPKQRTLDEFLNRYYFHMLYLYYNKPNSVCMSVR